MTKKVTLHIDTSVNPSTNAIPIEETFHLSYENECFLLQSGENKIIIKKEEQFINKNFSLRFQIHEDKLPKETEEAFLLSMINFSNKDVDSFVPFSNDSDDKIEKTLTFLFEKEPLIALEKNRRKTQIVQDIMLQGEDKLSMLKTHYMPKAIKNYSTLAANNENNNKMKEEGDILRDLNLYDENETRHPHKINLNSKI